MEKGVENWGIVETQIKHVFVQTKQEINCHSFIHLSFIIE